MLAKPLWTIYLANWKSHSGLEAGEYDSHLQEKQELKVVSLIWVPEKVMEQVILKTITQHLQDNQVVRPSHCVFMKVRSAYLTWYPMIELNIGVLPDCWLNASQQCAHITKKDNEIPACIKILWPVRLGNDFHLFVTLNSSVCFWVSYYRMDIELFQHFQRKAKKLVKGQNLWGTAEGTGAV